MDAAFATWRAPDGWPYRRMDWPQPAGAETRGRLLFCGGRGDFIEKYLECYHYWHARGWQVTAFDWRGQGASRGDLVDGNVASFDVLIDDLAALINDWAGGSDDPRVAVAHSMGAHLLLRTIVDRRPPLDAAVLVAPMLRINSAPLPSVLAPAITEFMCRIGRSDEPVWRPPAVPPPVGSRRQHYLTMSDERYADELWWWEQEPAFHLGGASWAWVRAAFRSAAATFRPSRLAEVELPVLLIGAEHDRLVSAAAIRDAARWLRRAELKMYPGAAHEILRDADPVRLDALETIDRFFDEQAR